MKKIFALLLTLSMLLGMIPVTATAEETQGTETTHTHCVCGGNCAAHTHTEDVEWKAVEKASDMTGEKTDGNVYYYYLTKNITITGDTAINVNGSKVHICLNGFTLTYSGSQKRMFNVYAGEISVGDCTGNGKVTTTKTDSGTGAMVCMQYSGSNGVFNLYGGTVAANGATASALIYNNQKTGTVNIYGGSVSGADCSADGAGVHVAYGTVNLYGGSISGNTSAGNGGGVLVSGADATFCMSGGTISGNKATNGGGVLVQSSGTFNMSGGSITGNTVGSGKSGGGVYLNNGCTMKLSGDAKITGAQNGGNLFLPKVDTAVVTVSVGTLTEGADISIYPGTNPTAEGITFATGVEADYSQYFSCGRKVEGADTCIPVYNAEAETLLFKTHNHAYTYSLSGNTITESCSECGHTATATVAVSSDVYTGEAITVTVTPGAGWAGNEAPAVTCEPAEVKNAGEYTAAVTCAEGTTVSYSFKVEKAAPTVTWPVVNGTIYIGDTLYSSNLTGGAGAGTFAVTGTKTWNEPGNYNTTVTFTPADATNYTTLEKTDVEVTVAAKTTTPDAFEDKQTPYTGAPITHTINKPEGVGQITFSYEGIDETEYAASADAPTKAGTYQVTATFTMESGYTQLDPVTAKLTITKASLTVTANAHTVTYGEAPSNSGVTYGSFVNQEGESDLTGVLAYDYNYNQYDAAGSYTITPKGLLSDNYDIQFVSGTLTVEQKELGITWTAPEDLEYDGNAKVPTAEITGTVNNDDIKVKVELTSGCDNVQAGTFTYTATALTGDKSDSYKLPEVVTSPEYTITMPAHAHCVCGGSVDGHSHDVTQEWVAVSEAGDLQGTKTGGEYYYYLANNITFTGSQAIGIKGGAKVHICLNGYTLTHAAPNNNRPFNIYNGELSISDCQGGGKVVSSQENIKGTIALFQTGNDGGNSVLNLYGGTLQATADSTKDLIAVQQKSGFTSVFNMYGGSITGAKATVDGAGVNVYSGTFNLYGGAITGNTTTGAGGGVRIAKNAKFNLNGGSVTGNTAANGGGIVVENGAAFTMNGGSVTGNTVTTGNGGGIYINPGAAATFGGDAKVKENTKTDVVSNIFLRKDAEGNQALVSVGSLKTGADIGLYLAKDPLLGAPVVISGEAGETDAQYFHYDKDGCHVAYADGKLRVEVDHDTHQHTYSVSGNVITQVCPCGHSAQAMVQAESVIYTGSPIGVVLTPDQGWSAAAPVVSYQGRGETVYASSATAPTQVGDYTAVLSFDGQQVEYPYTIATDHTHNYTYTLTGNTITESCTCGHTATAEIAVGAQVATGETVSFTVTPEEGWMGNDPVSVAFTRDGENAAEVKEAGTYVATITVASGKTVTYSFTLQAPPKPHEHCVCGGNCAAHTHTEDVEWKAVEKASDMTGEKTDGNVYYYYLTKNITITGDTAINVKNGSKVHICLNGFTLTYSGSQKRMFNVYVGEISVGDCTGNGKVTTTKTDSGTGAMVCMQYSGSNGVFNLYGGTVTANGATVSALIYNNQKTGTVNIYGGTISGANCSTDGAGVHVAYGTVNLYGGSISGNTSAGNGGGVLVSGADAAFCMYGGTITNNTATNAGGVLVQSEGTIRIAGGKITNNTATTGNGGGIYVNPGTTAVFSDDAIVIDNEKNETANNIFLRKDKEGNQALITLEELSEQAKLSVNTPDVPKEGKPVVISTVTQTDCSQSVVYDNTRYRIAYDEAAKALVAMVDVTHTCSFETYTINGNTITASCSCGQFVTARVQADGAVYTGKPIGVTVTGKDGWTATAKITYQGRGQTVYANSAQAPALVGDYTAIITFAEGKQVEYSYSIAQAGEGHLHCVCGGKADHGTCAERLWLPVSTEAELRAAAQNGGNYYLTADIALTQGAIDLTGTMGLCLHGHTVSRVKLRPFKVSGGSLDITDCIGTGAVTCTGSQVDAGGLIYITGKGAEVNLYSGALTGGRADNGGGVYVAYGSFNMYGGSITGNQAVKGNGGGVYVKAGGQFQAAGGSISGNGAAGEDSPQGGGIFFEKAESSFRISHVTISNNKAAWGGGIAMLSGNSLVLEDVQMTGNAAASRYGALYNNGNAKLTDCTLENNTAFYHGGAIGSGKNAVLELTDCILTGNTAENNHGGALYTESATVTITGSQFNGNTAKQNGGALYTQAGKVTVINGVIEQNQAGGDGGGYYVRNGKLSMSDSKLTGNTATGNGGGLVISTGAEANLTKVTAAENKAYHGGGILLQSEGSTLNMTDTEIAGNLADYNGGGLYISKNVKMTLTDGTIKNNKANNGGGIYIYGGSLQLEGGTVSGNRAVKLANPVKGQANGAGGGIAISAGGQMTMAGGAVSGNHGEDAAGGILVQSQDSVLTIADGTVTNNSTSGNGGGVYASTNTNLYLKGGKISGNKAKSGGGVYCHGAAMTMSGGTVSGHAVSENGGGVVISKASAFTMNGGTISGNSAKAAGGLLVQSKGSSMVMNGGSISDNRATSTVSGGGIYISTNCTAKFYGGTIARNTTPGDGAGIRANTATVLIDGVTVRDNAADGNGGGICAGRQSAVTMNSGLFTGNTAGAAAGGVLVQGVGSTFTMNGGDILENEAVTTGGGLYCSNVPFIMTGGRINNNRVGNQAAGAYINGTFTMSGGEICGNKCLVGGTSGSTHTGGVCIAGKGLSTISGGKINDNESTGYCGGVRTVSTCVLEITGGEICNNTSAIHGGGLFIMGKVIQSGGKVSGNTATNNGGGYYICSGGSLEQTGGEITGNTAVNGGAVYVEREGAYQMIDGTVSENQASVNGGGVYGQGTVELLGGTLTKNTAGNIGGGAYLDYSVSDGEAYITGVFTLGGKILAVDNTSVTGSDVYLTAGTAMSVRGGVLSEGAQVGISLEQGSLTQMILGAYDYQQTGENSYLLTCGTLSLEQPTERVVPEEKPAKPDDEMDQQLVETQPEQTEEAPAESNTSWILPVCGIVIVLAVAVIILLALKRRKTANSKTGS